MICACHTAGLNYVLYVTEWMRVSFTTFFSSEGTAILGLTTVPELKSYVYERFHGVLQLVIKSADRTNSPIPDWAKSAIETGWNIKLDEPLSSSADTD